jgi:hypothetical protein
MRIVHRLTAAVGAGAIVMALVGGPAGAATPEVFAGSAAGRALGLTVLGQKATFGVSTAKVNSTLNAVAEGAGQLLVLASTTKADVTGNNTKQSAPQACAQALPAVPVLSLGLACSESSAEVVEGLPHAVSEGSLVSLGLALNDLPINTVIAPVQGALEQVFGALPDAIDPATATVTDLLKAIGETKTLEAKVGHSRSEVSTVAGTVTSTGVAEAAQVDILPIGALDKNPVASIIVGSAKATAIYDRKAGASKASFDPAIVTLRLNTVLTGAQEIKVAPGETITILQGTPLESTITVADGKTIKNADGSMSAVADGVKLELLKGVNGGIVLELAHAEAAVAGALPVADQVAPAFELPRTGGTPWIPVVGVSTFALAVLVRRFVVSAR